MSRLREMLKLHEGEKKYPYKCTAGKLTIGVGRNLEARGLMPDEIELMLTNDIHACEADLASFPWWAGLDQVRKDALIDMRFNLGPGGFRGFVNTIEAIHRRDWNKAADNMLKSKWASQVGKRAQRLANMIRTGEYDKH